MTLRRVIGDVFKLASLIPGAIAFCLFAIGFVISGEE